MNTADLSVLSDELVVSLNPLRRGVQRARAVCASLTGLAMPWAPSATGIRARRPVGSGTTPARWPFPPAPPEDGRLTGNAAIAPGGPAAEPAASPALTPVPARAPVMPAVPAAPAIREDCLGNATVEPISNQVTLKAMVTDVVLVLAWGAMIPGLMWLGVAGGF